MMWHQPGFELGASQRAKMRVRNLSAGYGPIAVLRDMNIDIDPGLTVILGPNGAGKTTLLRALNGLIPYAGEVLFNGDDLPEKTHEIGEQGRTIGEDREGRNKPFGALPRGGHELTLRGWLTTFRMVFP